eukprot:82417-Hanusia_phi.AAC.2
MMIENCPCEGCDEGTNSRFFVEASVVTVSGLQPVQIFEGTMFHPHALAGKYANKNGSDNGDDSFLRQGEGASNHLSRSTLDDDFYDEALDPSQLEAIASNTGLQLIRELPCLTPARCCRNFAVSGCAQLLIANGREEAALSTYKKAILADPSNVLALIQCSDLLSEHDYTEESEMLRNCAKSIMSKYSDSEGEEDLQAIMQEALIEQQQEVERTPLPNVEPEEIEGLVETIWSRFQEVVHASPLGMEQAEDSSAEGSWIEDTHDGNLPRSMSVPVLTQRETE